MKNQSINNLELIVSSLPEGVTPKVTVLKTRKPRKGELIMSRVGGGKTAWRPSLKAGHASRRQRAGNTPNA